MGAYAGVFTILAGKVVEEERGRVFTFEPQKRFCEILEANLKLNRLSNIVVREGKVTMKGMVVRGWGRGYIECTTLDAWARASHPERLDFIKMDVEGFERKVLRGGMEILVGFFLAWGYASTTFLIIQRFCESLFFTVSPHYHIALNVTGKKYIVWRD